MNQFLLVFIQIKSDSSKDLNRIAQYCLKDLLKVSLGKLKNLTLTGLTLKKRKIRLFMQFTESISCAKIS
jgi:hypothetical protein